MRRAVIIALLCLVPQKLSAQPLSAVEAAALLAETRAANSKCSFLASAASEELSIYSGRAEVGAVEAVGAEVTSQRLEQARVDGANYPCDDESARKVTDIYTAAREAMNSVMTRQQPAPQAAPPARVTGQPLNITPQPQIQQPRIAQAKPMPVLQGRPGYGRISTNLQPDSPNSNLGNLKIYPTTPEARKAAAKPQAPRAQRAKPQAQPQVTQRAKAGLAAGGLKGYAWRSYAYYAAIRCPSLPRAQMQRFWRNIANEHGHMLETENPAAIEQAQRHAQQQAAKLACNAQTRQLVLRAISQY